MKKSIVLAFAALAAAGCKDNPKNSEDKKEPAAAVQQDTFKWIIDRFADVKVLRYKIPDFDKLTLQQKKLVYYLTQAGLSGRDIMYDQNYRYNLTIRKAFEHILKDYKGQREGADWSNLLEYGKKMWFSNGIHHHYGNEKFIPAFSKEYFAEVLKNVGHTLAPEVITAMFDPNVDAKKVNLDPNKDLIKYSAVNFYSPGITEREVSEFYKKLINPNDPQPISYGLNSKLVKDANGKLREEVYKVNGLYGPAIKEIIKWLEKAVEVAENEPQKKALQLLIEYYKTGDLKKWDDYSVAWTKAVDGDIDYINSFIEVYQDPMGYKGSYESIVEIRDFKASEQMKKLSENAQWFEDNSSILPEHKKKNVVGVTYKVVNVAGESGDASPSTPIGVNLPNAEWIRKIGSKSVSLGNIVAAYEASDGPGMLKEFANDEEEIALAQKYGGLASELHTALHEVVGHASGQLEPGVGTPKETLTNYSSALEEGRADLVALYFLMDPKMVEFGLMPSVEVGKAEYDSYLRNGYMVQLRRIQPGNNIEEAHMRNRQMIARWVIEKGQKDGSVAVEKRGGKTYVNIKDYDKVRQHFGELLRETQRIKSQGDYAAVKDLFENYGVKVDPVLHKEVLDRSKPLDLPAYAGFVNPELEPVMDAQGNITDIKVNYPDDFVKQMLYYGEKYGFLPEKN